MIALLLRFKGGEIIVRKFVKNSLQRAVICDYVTPQTSFSMICRWIPEPTPSLNVTVSSYRFQKFLLVYNIIFDIKNVLIHGYCNYLFYVPVVSFIDVLYNVCDCK